MTAAYDRTFGGLHAKAIRAAAAGRRKRDTANAVPQRLRQLLTIGPCQDPDCWAHEYMVAHHHDGDTRKVRDTAYVAGARWATLQMLGLRPAEAAEVGL